MIGVPQNMQDGDTVSASGGRLVTTTERGGGIRSLMASIVNLLKTGSTIRTHTMQDADGTIPLLEVTPVQSFQNKLLNPRFDIWQSGTSVGPFLSQTYGADQWLVAIDGSGSATMSRQTLTLGGIINEPAFCGRFAVTVLGTSTTIEAIQRVESVRTFANKTIIMSFWARADSARTLNLRVQQVFGTGGAPSASVYTGSGTAALTTTFAKFTYVISVPSISGKTLGTNGDDYISFSVYITSAAGAYIEITDAEMKEVATTAQVNTPFEIRPPGLEKTLCQRFFQTSYAPGAAFDSATGATEGMTCICINTSDTGNGGLWPVPMRAAPTVTLYSPNGAGGTGSARNDGSGVTVTGVTASGATATCAPRLTKGGGLDVVGTPFSAHFTAAARL